MRMEDHLYGIDSEVWNSIIEGPLVVDGLSGRKLLAANTTLLNDQKKRAQNDV